MDIYLLRKDAEPETPLAAVAVARGKTYIYPAVGRKMLRSIAPNDDLTPRETEGSAAIGSGAVQQGNRWSAFHRRRDLKSHVNGVLAKLQAENRSQATLQALKRGLVSLEELD